MEMTVSVDSAAQPASSCGALPRGVNDDKARFKACAGPVVIGLALTLAPQPAKAFREFEIKVGPARPMTGPLTFYESQLFVVLFLKLRPF